MESSRALRPVPAASFEGLREGIQRWAFVAAIGLSAFLLFSLELLAGRRVLPVFGGAPAVWTTVLCFFTGVLFFGYLYAHVVAARLSLRAGGFTQLALAAAAVGVAVFTPAHLGSLRFSEVPTALNVLLVLGVVAGGPALLLAATTPLLSSWYAARGNDPWWLFAVSNGASFLALLAYPLLIEPSIGLSAQRGLLAAGLVAYGASLVPIIFGAPRRATMAAETLSAAPAAALSTRRQAIWLLAALVPAGLLSATTNFLQTDLISAPLIWIGPLAIYLASFVAAFSPRGRTLVRACTWLVPAAATLLWVPFVKLHEGWPPIPLFVIELGALFVLAVAIHGRLAGDRPDSRLLTRFYLIVTAGGALGTAFVAIVAPLVFSTIYEYPILIVAGLIVLVLLPDAGDGRVHGRRHAAWFAAAGRLLPYGAIAGALYLLIDAREPATAANARNVMILGAVVVAFAVTPKALAAVASVTLALLIAINSTSPLVRTRTFFGVIEVRQGAGVHTEYSGTTLHGLQFTDSRGAEPSTYYSRVGPLGSVFDHLRSRTGEARIGVVGLGIGTIAAYARAGDEMTFYEIDQTVVDIARDPAYFTYISHAAVEPRIVVGDARLSLEDQPFGSFDLLVLDAFSSDTVPAHLLTREAIETYARTLRPGGVLAFHLSNRYYDLVGPVAATARSAGLDALSLNSVVAPDAARQYGASGSLWLVAGSSGDVAAFSDRGWSNVAGGYVLTDDYSDLTRSLDFGSF